MKCDMAGSSPFARFQPGLAGRNEPAIVESKDENSVQTLVGNDNESATRVERVEMRFGVWLFFAMGPRSTRQCDTLRDIRQSTVVHYWQHGQGAAFVPEVVGHDEELLGRV